MKPEITLKVNNNGKKEEIRLTVSRFSIGRSQDNNLVISDVGISRRQCILENFDGILQISDCGSEKGTEVNKTLLTTPLILKDGDLVSLTNNCDITISIHSASSNISSATQIKENKEVFPAIKNNVNLLAALTLTLIMVGFITLFFLKNNATNFSSSLPKARYIEQGKDDIPLENREEESLSNENSSTVSLEQVEKAAVQFIHNISNDDKPYTFPEKAINDIKARIEQYRTSENLTRNFERVQALSAKMSNNARRANIEPPLLIYLVLTEINVTKIDTDPLLLADRILPELRSLRATFGSELADSTLLIVAGYKIGGSTKKSHPLLVTIRRTVKNPLVERNVWYLYEHNQLDPPIYNFIIELLTIGTISQNPHQFGINSTILTF